MRKVNALIAQIADGKLKALDRLFELTSRMLYAMARSYLKDKSMAEDVVSETYLKVVRSAASFDSGRNGLNWMFKIAKNTAFDLNNKYPCAAECVAEDVGEMEDWAENIFVDGALQTLSEQERNIVYMRFWQGLKVREMAHELGVPVSTAHDELKRTLKKLEKLLK